MPEPNSPPPPKPQLRLATGEVIVARWPHLALEHGMLSTQLWLRGDVGALQAEQAPAGWDGQATWWLPEKDRRAGLLSLLPDLMRWLPPSVAAPRKLQIAERMAFPERWPARERWGDDAAVDVRPFVDAVFVDDAAHLHLVDVAAAHGDGNPIGAWQSATQMRDLGRHWLQRSEPGSRFNAEYEKLRWLRRQSPLDGIFSLIGSRGDEMPNRTAEAFWHWVGRRCIAYWTDELPWGQRGSPYCILVTDADMPPEPEEDAATLRSYGNTTLACVTPFVLNGATWVHVDVRSWASKLGERLLLSSDWVCRMAGATDVGKRRTANQDAVLWSEEGGWAAVADGMGGHPNGDVASATVLRVFEDAMHRWPDEQAPHRRRTVAQRLRNAAAEAHAALWKENEGQGIFQRMGTTFSALRLHGDELSIVHAGDSRIYRFKWSIYDRDSPLRRLTIDHGEGSGVDRALGLWERVPVEIDTLPIEDGALYLLCTDGLTNMLGDEEIQRLCLEHRPKDGAERDLEALVGALIDAANDAGGDDNITVCVVETKEED